MRHRGLQKRGLQGMRPRAWRRHCLLGLVGCGLAVLGQVAWALHLGEPTVMSRLGQPLEMAVPIYYGAGPSVAPDCIRLVPAAEVDGALPILGAAIFSVNETGSWLSIESRDAIEEPALRVVLELGCERQVRRDFTVLLDPPGPNAPGGPPPGGHGSASGLALIRQ